MAVDQDVTLPEPSSTENSQSRKTSSVISHGHENLGFEPAPHRRKISTLSDHAEIGPVRKKSALYNMHIVENGLSEFGDQGLGQDVSNQASKKSYDTADSCHNSWIYIFCMKCRKRTLAPSWEPTFWNQLCPYPFGISYRQFSRITALMILLLSTYIIFFGLIGNAIAPGGYLFQLIILYASAYLGGWLVSLTQLPALIGMLLVGLLFQNIGIVNIDDSFNHITHNLRHVALVMILVRAGLDLDPGALKRLKFTVIKLSVGPWIIEMTTIAVFTHFLINLPWNYAFLLGSLIAAVAPAVVVPSLFRLRSKGYGVAKGIPTLIIAVAGIDDAASVAVFNIIKSLMFSNDSLTFQIMQGPLSLFGGIFFGALWGLMSKYIPEKNDPFVVCLRVLLLLTGSVASIFGSEMLGFAGAGPLACVSAAFCSLYFWCQDGWDIEDNPAAGAFEIFWLIIEPALFSVTGTAIKLNELDKNIIYTAIGILLVSMIIRIAGTVILGAMSKLNLKEKLFVSFSWISKATVQAALGPIALAVVNKNNTEEVTYCRRILMMSVLSIILTAPAGAFLISVTGRCLLTATKAIEMPKQRKLSRISFRDMAIEETGDEKN